MANLKNQLCLFLFKEKGAVANKISDFTDLLVYRDSVSNQPETPFQKITLDIIDKAIENLKAKSLV
jgi:hypothetical protein